MLIGTYIFAWSIYLRLTCFLTPSKETRRASLADQGFVASDNDDYFQEPAKTEFERRREIIAQQF